MPLIRCRNFSDSGSRKIRDGVYQKCSPDCRFVHPSDPDWDRAPPARSRGGGPPQGGRGRGQSSSWALASGANTTSLGQERGSSSVVWDDYMTGFGSNSSATSSARGASSHQRGKTTSGSNGWGDAGAGGSGWGTAAHNNTSTSGGWNELSACGEQASSSQWDAQPVGWESSGSGWGNTGTGLGSGWGEEKISDQTSKAPSAVAVTKSAASTSSDTPLGGTWTDGNIDVGTATTSSSRAMPPVSSPSEPDTTHGEQPGDDTAAQTTVDLSPLERKSSPSSTSVRQSLAIKSIRMRPPQSDHDHCVVSKSSDADVKSNLILSTATALHMRELDAELSQLSVLRKSQQVSTTRAAKDLLRNKFHKLTDARDAVEADHNDCSRDLMESDSLRFPSVRHTSTAFSRSNEQLKQLEDWISGAERYLDHIQAEAGPILSVERSNGIAHSNKLNLLKQRSDSLAETGLSCQDLQFYNTFLNHQIQDKKELIAAAIIKGQGLTHNHFFSTSLSTLQKQGETWNQTLQIQSGEFALALLQYNQLKEDERRRYTIKAEQRGTIQQLQADVNQKKLQLQALQEEISQFQHILTSLKHPQSQNTPHESAPYIQEYIKGYIQTNILSSVRAALTSSMGQFAAAESETVGKAWDALQPFLQMSIWLQNSDIYKTEEEMEIREIEESLVA